MCSATCSVTKDRLVLMCVCERERERERGREREGERERERERGGVRGASHLTSNGLLAVS